jgi:hypothetical protein
MVEGELKGFISVDYMATPERTRVHPAVIVAAIRGSLMFHTTITISPWAHTRRLRITRETGRLYRPRAVARMAMTATNQASRKRMGTLVCTEAA